MKVARIVDSPSKIEIYMIPFTCDCGTVFYIENAQDYQMEADIGYDGVVTSCPLCTRKVRHAVPLTSKETTLYSAIKGLW